MPALAEKPEKVARVGDNAPRPLAKLGSLGKAHQPFGDQLPKRPNELNETLAA